MPHWYVELFSSYFVIIIIQAQLCALADFIESTPELNNPKPLVFMTREERYENAMRKTVVLIKNASKLDISAQEESSYYLQ